LLRHDFCGCSQIRFPGTASVAVATTKPIAAPSQQAKSPSQSVCSASFQTLIDQGQLLELADESLDDVESSARMFERSLLALAGLMP
jgi:hypothetical protein